MAEWLYEEGIGENRAILVEDGEILEAKIELPEALKLGSVVPGRLTHIPIPGRRGLVEHGSHAIFVEPLPPALTKGQVVHVEIAREAIPEEDNLKDAKGRITDEPLRKGPSLLDRVGPCRKVAPPGPDPFEASGWSDLLEEALDGLIVFPGGQLRMSLTPAMVLFDVDGNLPPAELAIAGAAAAARAVRRHGIGGSIGIDLPTVASKAERQKAAAAVDALLPQPFERTAVNGFGFLQIVRRRERISIPELIRSDLPGASARHLLRRAERWPGLGARTLTASPAVIARLEGRQDWIEELSRRVGGPIALRSKSGLSTWGGHVHAEPR